MRLRTPGPGPDRAHHAQSDACDTLAGAAGAGALAYLDPPFGTGKRFYLAGAEPGADGPPAYDDPVLGHDEHLARASSLAAACRAGLRDDGRVVIQCDTNASLAYRLGFERVLGSGSFRGEVIVRSGARDRAPRPQVRPGLTPTHNTLLLFSQAELPPAPQLPSYPGAGTAGSEDLVDTLWTDLDVRGRTQGYPTEKSTALAERLLEWLSSPDELVVEPFCGSGTFSCTALRLGRRVRAGDASPVGTLVSGHALLRQLCRDRTPGSVEIPITRAPAPVDEARPGPTRGIAIVSGTGHVLELCDADADAMEASRRHPEGEAILIGDASARLLASRR